MVEPSHDLGLELAALVDAIAGGAERAREEAGQGKWSQGRIGRRRTEDWLTASGWLGGGGGCNCGGGGIRDSSLEIACVRGSPSTKGEAGWAVRETLPARTCFDESGAIHLEGPLVSQTYSSLFTFWSLG
jgi:hypothetical protein